MKLALKPPFNKKLLVIIFVNNLTTAKHFHRLKLRWAQTYVTPLSVIATLQAHYIILVQY